jgi:hypothetical protein
MFLRNVNRASLKYTEYKMLQDLFIKMVVRTPNQKQTMPYLKTISIYVINIWHMLLSRHQNAEQNHDINITHRSFENVAQFRYLGTTVTNQNLIQE